MVCPFVASLRHARRDSSSVAFRPVPLRRHRGPSGGDAARNLRARPSILEDEWT
jgi:hypothetical protein